VWGGGDLLNFKTEISVIAWIPLKRLSGETGLDVAYNLIRTVRNVSMSYVGPML
jgi:hypothetical protein